MNVREKKVLLRLHKKVLDGQVALQDRDALMLHYHDQGVSQTELASVIDAEFPGTMTRNAAQKVIARERARENGHGG